ncbi:MAG: pentapeptide repeat-containing protein [Alistipes communis]
MESTKQIKIEIRNRWTGSVVFEYTKEGNTITETVLDAIRRDANLRDADLRGANLCGANLCDADLRDANLCDADLRGANLRDANLYGADLRGADLRGANLCGANLCDANLRSANLSGANLRDADLRCADLCGANLYGADLRGADLRGANLYGADLRGANLRDAKGCYLSCPTEGSFIGWKKASGHIVKLRIPEDARRSSATGHKCRCDKAYVMEIQNMDGTKATEDTVRSDHDKDFVYTVGATVEVPDFDDNRWSECAPGIHFFIDRRAAVEY